MKIYTLSVLGIVLVLFSFIKKDRPILVTYSFSDCLTNSNVDSRLIDSSLTNEKLHLKLGIWLNCSVKKTSKIESEFIDDTLKIIIQESQYKIDTIKNKHGYTIKTSIKISHCNCFFNLDLDFDGVLHYPKYILINRNTLKENNDKKGSIIIERVQLN